MFRCEPRSPGRPQAAVLTATQGVSCISVRTPASHLPAGSGGGRRGRSVAGSPYPCDSQQARVWSPLPSCCKAAPGRAALT